MIPSTASTGYPTHRTNNPMMTTEKSKPNAAEMLATLKLRCISEGRGATVEELEEVQRSLQVAAYRRGNEQNRNFGGIPVITK